MEKFINPLEILKQINLREDMVAADFGSGSGGWVIPLAKQLEDGRVYAIDILEEPLSALRAKAKLNKILNIKTLLADVEKKVDLLDESCDLILMTNLLFQIEDKKKVLKEAERVLSPAGILFIVDWKENPPIEIKETVSFEDIKKIGEKTGLTFEKEFDAGKYHKAMVFTKNKR